MKIESNISLAASTTLGVGGPAKFFLKAESEDEVAAGVAFARDNGLDLFVLGGGSNLLVSDSGFDGLVLQVGLKGVSEKAGQTPKGVTLTAAAGEDWDALVERCVGEDLAGFECLSGIPGSVGGTPVQNVGAYGQEVSETIVSVRAFDRETLEFVELSNADCEFSYRKSIFNAEQRDRYIVTSVEYRLSPGGEPKIAYRELQEFFDGRHPSLRETREAVLAIRRKKSMVIDANDPNSRSAGSFFKNPIVDTSTADAIAEEMEIDRVPQFPFGEGKVKIPAAWLIEQAGVAKGFRLGRAGISQNHSLAIVNLGDASAGEIVALKELVEKKVRDRFAIELVPEPVFLGF